MWFIIHVQLDVRMQIRPVFADSVTYTLSMWSCMKRLYNYISRFTEHAYAFLMHLIYNYLCDPALYCSCDDTKLYSYSAFQDFHTWSTCHASSYPKHKWLVPDSNNSVVRVDCSIRVFWHSLDAHSGLYDIYTFKQLF